MDIQSWDTLYAKRVQLAQELATIDSALHNSIHTTLKNHLIQYGFCIRISKNTIYDTDHAIRDFKSSIFDTYTSISRHIILPISIYRNTTNGYITNVKYTGIKPGYLNIKHLNPDFDIIQADKQYIIDKLIPNDISWNYVSDTLEYIEYDFSATIFYLTLMYQTYDCIEEIFDVNNLCYIHDTHIYTQFNIKDYLPNFILYKNSKLGVGLIYNIFVHLNEMILFKRRSPLGG